ncbi:MAG: cytochrome P450 [Actinomycetota bacterium]|nr:cytochrome P450 [Actinomycetota bacterium]
MSSIADSPDLVPDEDPFAEFNRAMGSGVVSNPYPDFVERRRTTPVMRADIRQLMGLDVDAELPDMDMPEVWTIMSYDALCTVLRDGRTYSSSGYAEVMGAVMGHTILEMDEPEHGTYRAVVQQAFSRKAMARWETELVSPIVHGLIDDFVDDGRADLVGQLTLPFPVTVIAGLLGLPREDLTQFHRWAIELIGVSINWERGMAASEKLRDYFAAILDERRTAPSNDMISVLAGAEHDGVRLTDDEIFAFLRLLLPAGAETTYRSSSNLLYGLLRSPEQLEALRDDRTLMAQAIEEGLRWEPPLLTIMRTVSRDTTLAGVDLPAGAVLVVNLGSANHDEARWDDPERFDIFRPPKQHLAFAFGPHMCLGLHLARMETAVVMGAILDRLPDLHIDPDAEAPYITGMTFRAPPALPVVWG